MQVDVNDRNLIAAAPVADNPRCGLRPYAGATDEPVSKLAIRCRFRTPLQRLEKRCEITALLSCESVAYLAIADL